VRLVIVTATVDPVRALPYLRSWGDVPMIVVVNGGEGALPHELQNATWISSPELLGVVPAFARGVQYALDNTDASVIAALHDDLEIEQHDWDVLVRSSFEHPANRQVGLVGFGGATGLGSSDIYQAPYNPMQLVRHDFVSNLRHAEVHGRRGGVAERMACLDGFSQIGRRAYWQGLQYAAQDRSLLAPNYSLFTTMRDWGIVHHAYDAALGAFAKRLGWQVWYLPVACHHHGGLTAVADSRYLDWALANFTWRDWTDTKDVHGDAALWTKAHRIVYDRFRDVLPIRL